MHFNSAIMPHTSKSLIFSAAIIVATSLPAVATSGCIEPLFNTQKEAIITACTSDLAESSDTDLRFKALINRGRAYLVTGHNIEAARDFDAASELKPNDPDPQIRRGWVAFAQRDYQRVGTVVENVLKIKPDSAEAYDLLGSTAGAAGNIRLAKAAFDKAVESAPKRLMPRYHRFQFYKNTRQHQAALDELNELLKLNLPELDTMFDSIRHRQMSDRTMAHLEQATMLVAMGRNDEALKAYDERVKIEPSAVSYAERGAFYFDQEQYDLASSDLKKAISYDPTFWFPYNVQGWVAAYSRRYETAVPLFTDAIDREPGAGTSYWGRAIALREIKRTDDAINDAIKALTVDRKFFNEKAGALAELGYLVPPRDRGDRLAAVRDAARACMMDEKCW
jgi:tetratricopeptide (TPR) repeat protein